MQLSLLGHQKGTKKVLNNNWEDTSNNNPTNNNNTSQNNNVITNNSNQGSNPTINKVTKPQ